MKHWTQSHERKENIEKKTIVTIGQPKAIPQL